MDNDRPTVDVPPELWGTIVSNQLGALDHAYLQTDDEELKLVAYQTALAYLITHTKRFPGWSGGTEILDDLLLRLTDVVAGTPALQPIKKSGRPQQGWRAAVIQGRAVAGVDLLIKHGDLEADACKAIAAGLAKAGYRGRQGGPLSPATLRDWRSRAALHGDKEDARFIREHVHALAPLVDIDGLTKSEFRRRVVAFVTGGAAMRGYSG